MQESKFPAVLGTFLLCFCFWVLLTWSFTAQELLVGAVVSLAVALFAARFFIHENGLWLLNPAKWVALLGYVFVFLGELVKANMDMAKRCLSGCKDINPGIVKIPTGMKSDYGVAAVGNSITLTPGTITMETTEEDGQNYLYVHWIDVAETDPEKAGEIIKGSMERALRRVWQ